jgi:hypothetical protein
MATALSIETFRETFHHLVHHTLNHALDQVGELLLQQ